MKAPVEMRFISWRRTWKQMEDATGASWEQCMNKSPGVPIIAVVDDDDSVRESLAGLVESVGYEVALFASAEEFLRSAHGHDSLAALILDVRLPGMSGVELYARLPRNLRSITVFITAHADLRVRTWAGNAEAIAVLLKPFQPEALLQAVRKAILQPRS
jgi:FixJ family two-component response regulator